MGEFKTAAAALDGAREGAFFVPEQFAFDEGFGHGGAVDGDKGTVAAGAELVEGARGEFLSGAGFTRNQDCGGRGRDLADERKDLLHLGRAADQFAEDAAGGELAFERLAVFGQAPLGDGALEEKAEGAGLHGFFEEPEGAEVVDHADGGFDVAEGGEDDCRWSVALFLEAAEEFGAVDAGHHEVGNDGGGGEFLQDFESFAAVGSGGGGVAPGFQHGGKSGALVEFVIDDEDAGLAGFGHGSFTDYTCGWGARMAVRRH